MPRACNLPDLLAWSKVAYNQDMPHFTQIGPEPRDDAVPVNAPDRAGISGPT
jgi:hypothetical protein